MILNLKKFGVELLSKSHELVVLELFRILNFISLSMMI